MSLTYEYNDVSNITAMLDNLGAGLHRPSATDELGRLTDADGH
ncbi:MAG: hypothetical protein U5O39_07870 [Gammaproteobacteria bacterium]|nr:hypothetical protein [Gammaproteobacteria bacterium]